MTKPNGRHSQESVGTIKTVSVLRDFAKLVWIGSTRTNILFTFSLFKSVREHIMETGTYTYVHILYTPNTGRPKKYFVQEQL